MATPTKCEEKRLEGADPRTGYRARLLGKETNAYTAPGAMDNRDDHATERSGAKEKEEGATLQEKRPRPQGPREKIPRPGRSYNPTEATNKKRKGGRGAGRERDGHPAGQGERGVRGTQAAREPRTP